MNDDIDQIVNWALSDEPVTVKQPAYVPLFPAREYEDETLLQKISLVRTMADAAWSHPGTYTEASRLEDVWGDLMREARRRGIQDDIDQVVFAATSGNSLPRETAPDPRPKTKRKPSQDKRWRCMVVGCNPVLDEETAKQHHALSGHRVAKWPVRSAEGKRRAKERNRTGYYRKYNEAAAYADAVAAGRFRDTPSWSLHPFEDVDETEGYFDNTEHQNHDFDERPSF